MIAVGLSLPKFKPLIDERLRIIFANAIAAARPIDQSYVELLEVMQSQLLRSGKRLRPYLTYLAYLGAGGADTAAIVPAAASQELFHHFLLIHDDVIDRDLVRHGGPNVAGTYTQRFAHGGMVAADSAHYSAAYAILAGDVSCSLAFQAILSAGFDPIRRLAAVDRLQRMLFEILGGELMDVHSSLPITESASLEHLLKICHYKTSTYSFEAPLQVGALLAGAPYSVQAGLLAFGRPLGIAFQLADDLLGVYGDEATLGKSVLGDMREGKQTVLMHLAYQDATPKQAEILRRLWGNQASGPSDLAVVQQILNDSGAVDKIDKLKDHYLQQSLTALEAAAIDPAIKVYLTDLAQFCISREY